MKQLQQLEKFVVENADLEELEARLASFNLFEAVGMRRQEIRHSATLAFLLDPQSQNGVGQYFLKKLLKEITAGAKTPVSPIFIDCEDFSDAEVRREWKNIDILIVCDKAQLVVAIENKIDADEHDEQLPRYQKVVEQEKDWAKYQKLFVFLTVDGHEPENAEDRNVWTSFSHEPLVAELQKTLEVLSDSIGSDQQVLIRHYIELMRRHVLSDSEIAKLARKIYRAHKTALDIILEHMPDMRQSILDHLVSKVEDHTELKLGVMGSGMLRFTQKNWSFGNEWKKEKGPFHRAGVTFECYVSKDVNKIRLELVIGDLPIDGNKEKLAGSVAERLNYSNITVTRKYPRAWRGKVLDLSDMDVEAVLKEIDEWWKRFIEEELSKISSAVNNVLDEIGARPTS